MSDVNFEKEEILFLVCSWNPHKTINNQRARVTSSSKTFLMISLSSKVNLRRSSRFRKKKLDSLFSYFKKWPNIFLHTETFFRRRKKIHWPQFFFFYLFEKKAHDAADSVKWHLGVVYDILCRCSARRVQCGRWFRKIYRHMYTNLRTSELFITL